MNFQDILQEEAIRVFLNPDAFGEPIMLNDVQVIGIISHRQVDYPESDSLPELRQERRRLSVATDELPFYPEQGRVILCNDKDWIIEDWSESLGITTLELYREVI